MSKKKFKENKIIINKVYTKRGDKGSSDLIGGSKVAKDDLRLCAFGEVDELNSFVGSCSVYIKENYKKKLTVVLSKLDSIQHELFNLGNMLAIAEGFSYDSMPMVDESSILFLEDSSKDTWLLILLGSQISSSSRNATYLPFAFSRPKFLTCPTEIKPNTSL